MPNERRRMSADSLHRGVIRGVNRGTIGVSTFQEVFGSKERGVPSRRHDSMHALR
jgi:hypothetical protein